MKKPVIYFDWDGTLGDSMDLCLGEIRLALKRIGHAEVEEEKIRACNGPTHEESVVIMGMEGEEGEAFLRERRRAERELIPVLLRTYPGVEELLRTLQQHADLAIVSNGQKDYIELSVATFHLTDCFVRIQILFSDSAAAELLKPFSVNQGWSLGDDGVWYYTERLLPGTSTTPVFSNVEFKADVTKEEIEAVLPFEILIYAESVTAGNRNLQTAWDLLKGGTN